MEISDEPERLGTVHRMCVAGIGSVVFVMLLPGIESFKEIVNSHSECVRDGPEFRRGDAILSKFVLLNLLECQADFFCQTLLAFPNFGPSCSYPVPNM